MNHRKLWLVASLLMTATVALAEGGVPMADGISNGMNRLENHLVQYFDSNGMQVEIEVQSTENLNDLVLSGQVRASGEKGTEAECKGLIRQMKQAVGVGEVYFNPKSPYSQIGRIILNKDSMGKGQDERLFHEMVDFHTNLTARVMATEGDEVLSTCRASLVQPVITLMSPQNLPKL